MFLPIHMLLFSSITYAWWKHIHRIELIWHCPCLMRDSKRLVRSSSPGPRTHAEPNEHITLPQLTSRKSALCFSFTSSYVTLAELVCCLWDCHVTMFISTSGFWFSWMNCYLSSNFSWVSAYMVCILGRTVWFKLAISAYRCSLELNCPPLKTITILVPMEHN